MKKIIVYGLGTEYEIQKRFIESEFEIIGYSDKRKIDDINYIKLEEISNYQFDAIYVTSLKYKDEMVSDLKRILGEVNIITKEDIWGDFRNFQVRYKWITEKLDNLEPNKVLLDAGAGEMRYASHCRHLKYIAQDFGKYNPNENQEGIRVADKWDTSKVNITCDIIKMPLEDNSIDIVLCTEVFEHLKNPILAVEEFSRVLKSGGKLILTAPFCSLTHMAPYYYSNGFSKYWYFENLKEFGFEIKELKPYGNYFQWLSQELLRVNGMAQRYCNDQLSEEDIATLSDSLKLMKKLSSNDNGSSETLCFGHMVEAYRL